jgi:ABC-type bacteriocin/lantibiotic exporter with double-glycine peptidase domain
VSDLAGTTATQLTKALASHGITVSARVVADACGAFDMGSVARGLRRLGVEARLVRVRAGDLRCLAPLWLVWLVEGPPALLVASGPSGARLELASGAVHAMSTREAASIRGRAIVVRARVPSIGSFASRMKAAARSEPRFASAVALVIGMGVASTLLGLVTPLLSRLALSEAIPERASAKLAAAAIAILLLFVHVAWAGWIRRRATIFLETKVNGLGVEEVVRHLLGLPFARLDRLEVGHVIELTRAAQAVSTQFVVVASAILDGVTAVGYLVFVFWLDAFSGFAVLGGAVVLVALGMLRGRRSFELRAATVDAGRKQQHALFETIAGVETVKAEAAEERMLVRYLSRLLTVQGLALKEQLEMSVFDVASLGIDRLVYGTILLLLAQRTLSGRAEVGDLIAAVQASASFFVSAQAVARVPHGIYGILAQTSKIDEALSEPTESLEPVDSSAIAPEGHDAVVVRNVWFRYDPAAPWVLRELDVVVPKGATVVLDWPSGGGKSTLLRLLSGLVSPERGDVLIFGTEASRARHLVSYLPQHAALLPLPIMENLRLLSGGASIERIAAAAAATGLAELVKGWPMGYETVVSAGGANVSSGQRQLVLFTAALASPAPILLLDEAFAHMDAIMRSKLASLDLLRGRTVIAVVHDATSRERGAATFVLGHREARPRLRA